MLMGLFRPRPANRFGSVRLVGHQEEVGTVGQQGKAVTMKPDRHPDAFQHITPKTTSSQVRAGPQNSNDVPAQMASGTSAVTDWSLRVTTSLPRQEFGWDLLSRPLALGHRRTEGRQAWLSHGNRQPTPLRVAVMGRGQRSCSPAHPSVRDCASLLRHSGSDQAQPLTPATHSSPAPAAAWGSWVHVAWTSSCLSMCTPTTGPPPIARVCGGSATEPKPQTHAWACPLHVLVSLMSCLAPRCPPVCRPLGSSSGAATLLFSVGPASFSTATRTLMLRPHSAPNPPSPPIRVPLFPLFSPSIPSTSRHHACFSRSRCLCFG